MFVLWQVATVVKAEFESIEVILGFGTNFQNFGTNVFVLNPISSKLKDRKCLFYDKQTTTIF